MYDYLAEIGTLAESIGIESLTPGQQVVLVTDWAYGIHMNGGFQYFYEGANNVEQVDWAMREVGLPEVAAAFTESARIFPKDILLGTHEERTEWMDKDITEPFWEPLNNSVWDVGSKKITEKIRDYMTTHPKDFRFAP